MPATHTRTLPWYLDTAKARCEIATDRALADRIGVHQSQVVLYRKRHMTPSTTPMIRLAEAAGVPAEVALIDRALWIAETDKERDLWRSLLGKAQAQLTAAVGAVAVAAMLGLGAAPSSPAAASPQSVYYGKQRHRRTALDHGALGAIEDDPAESANINHFGLISRAVQARPARPGDHLAPGPAATRNPTRRPTWPPTRRPSVMAERDGRA